MPAPRRPRASTPETAEAAARNDLAAFPPRIRSSALAVGYLLAARRIDAGVTTRELPNILREMRQCLLTLNDMAPAKPASDPGDQLAKRREARMQEAARKAASE